MSTKKQGLSHEYYYGIVKAIVEAIQEIDTPATKDQAINKCRLWALLSKQLRAWIKDEGLVTIPLGQLELWKARYELGMASAKQYREYTESLRAERDTSNE